MGQLLTMNTLHVAKFLLPYSGKLSREKTFANFADLSPFVKVFFANIACARNLYRYSMHPRKFSPRNLRARCFRESFLPRKFPAIRYSVIGDF